MARTRQAKVRSALIKWYEKEGRDLPWRRTQDPYRIWVSEVMLQQTRVETVIPYYRRFVRQYPRLSKLARSDLQTVLKQWEGLGYYARARNFFAASQIVDKEHGGIVPRDPVDFQKLPGVGDYLCAAVLSIAYEQPLAAVDGNVKRVLSRLEKIDAPVNQSANYKLYKEVASCLIDPSCPGIFNQAMMDLGATICTPRNPFCADCPVSKYCKACRFNMVSIYPYRIPRRPVPTQSVAVGVVFRAGKVLITRRKPQGLLGGLWEFPGGKIRQNETSKAACIREIKEETGITVDIVSHLKTVQHAYTHFRLVMEVYLCKYRRGTIRLNGPIDYHWVTADKIGEFPFPKANHKFIPLIPTDDVERSFVLP